MNGTRVPVLCPEEVQKAMQYLANDQVRKKAGINIGNTYLFANTALNVVRAGDSLDELKRECDLKFPERLLATNLRKYCATIAQVIGLKDHELKYLCRHMGHTMQVHETHYRSTSGLIERLEIAKLMLIQERNMVGMFQGKSLNEITFEDILQKDDTNVPGSNNHEEPAEIPDSIEAMDIDSVLVDDGDDGDDALSSRKKAKKANRVRWSATEEK